MMTAAIILGVNALVVAILYTTEINQWLHSLGQVNKVEGLILPVPDDPTWKLKEHCGYEGLCYGSSIEIEPEFRSAGGRLCLIAGNTRLKTASANKYALAVWKAYTQRTINQALLEGVD